MWEHCPHAYQSVSCPLVAHKPTYPAHVVMVTYSPHSIHSPTHTYVHRACPQLPRNIPDVSLPTCRGEKADRAACWFENSHAPDCPHSEESGQSGAGIQVYTLLLYNGERNKRCTRMLRSFLYIIASFSLCTKYTTSDWWISLNTCCMLNCGGLYSKTQWENWIQVQKNIFYLLFFKCPNLFSSCFIVVSPKNGWLGQLSR